MKKITMFVVSLFLVMGVVAQIDTNQEYRLKNVETGLYLNAANYDEHSSGTHGGVSVAEKAESDAQIFSFAITSFASLGMLMLCRAPKKVYSHLLMLVTVTITF